MNAQEARKMAVTINDDTVKKQYKEVKLVIAKVAAEGKFRVWIYQELKERVVAILCEEGFAVGKPKYDRNEVSILIEW